MVTHHQDDRAESHLHNALDRLKFGDEDGGYTHDEAQLSAQVAIAYALIAIRDELAAIAGRP
jgi:hypothetical protein